MVLIYASLMTPEIELLFPVLIGHSFHFSKVPIQSFGHSFSCWIVTLLASRGVTVSQLKENTLSISENLNKMMKIL